MCISPAFAIALIYRGDRRDDPPFDRPLRPRAMTAGGSQRLARMLARTPGRNRCQIGSCRAARWPITEPAASEVPDSSKSASTSLAASFPGENTRDSTLWENRQVHRPYWPRALSYPPSPV
jgi:hypothetical protein